ncbi:MAG: DUF4835 family protein [Chitinophagaceae bacterium]|jgi:hypothetical protein|uniref:type IX secretion system protein PorD n=1 Tax=unclassified Paraflavitalea TaxID=2798305 RepID=UPI003D33A1A5|nr:DUF4835 family protein [Chitinophagaceae bacterium]
MRIRFLIVLLMSFGLTASLQAQELNARVAVNASLISSQTDKKVFQTLQTTLNTFLNNRKWTNDTYQPQEKINCNFLITIKKTVADNVYSGTLVVQAARPIFNSSYQSPLINFQDESFTFKYVEYQPVEFNENRVSGSDPQVSNLSATLAYYVYLLLGLDYDSFSSRGGDLFFQKAQQIVNNAPDGRDITGWKPFDSQRNRYWLAENLANNKYALIHDIIYGYYRLGLDMMYENEEEGRNALLNVVNLINTLNTDNPNSMIVPFFFQGKATEIVKALKKADPEAKTRARDILAKIDITNSNLYKQELK